MASVNWRPGVHDAGPLAWVIVAGYAACLLLLTAVALRANSGKAFWWLSPILVAGLGVNKQLDAQTLLIELGRTAIREEGWIAQRHTVGVGFALGLAAASACWVALSLRLLAKQGVRLLFAVAGVVVLLGYLVLRTSALLHVDVLAGDGAEERGYGALELVGQGLLLAGAALELRHPAAASTAPG